MSVTPESSPRRWIRSVAGAVVALMASSIAAVALGVGVAGADTAPVDPTEPETVAADSLPTVQIDGVVWDQVVVGNTVYATGSFTSARPAGSAAGTNETPRSNILAYDITTGNLITSWAPTLNAQGRTLEASADGNTIYVAGDFTQVNGTTRNRVAALDATTGVLRPFNPNVNAHVNSLALSGDTLYVGGAFTVVGNQGRSRLAAVDAASGALREWAPVANLEVRAVVVPANKGKVVVGGHFDDMNGVPTRGLAALDPTTGALVPFPANQIIQNWGADAAIWSLSTNDDQVFGTGFTYLVNNDPTTGGNLESTFAADATTGELMWVSGCRGDHYDTAPIGNVLYNVSHAHDCAPVGGHPQTSPWTFQRAQAETIYPDPSGAVNVGGKFNGRPRARQLHWLPTMAIGTFTGQAQAAWTVEGNSQYVVMGGEFPRVNGANQQGLARFAVKSIAPNKDLLQGYPEFTPTLVPISAGSLRISWQGVWDRDNAQLTYEVLRGATVNTSTVVATRTYSPSNWWYRPMLAAVDASAAPGSTETYRVRVRDAFGNGFVSPAVTGTVPAGTPTPSPYRDAVIADSPAKYWRLGEAAGTIGYDQVGADDLTLNSNTTRGVVGALIGDSDTSTTFAGGTAPASTNGTAVNGPQQFTVEAWFKTTTSSGGKIVGFGKSSTGSSTSYDRHIYMTNGGQLRFGVYDGSTRTVASSAAYNDGQWHQAVGQLGPAGIKLYVDGKLVGADASATSAEAFAGYWRIGGDALGGWPSQPSSANFNGTIDDVSIYGGELTQDQIRAHFLASGRTPGWPTVPADAYGAAVWNANADLYLRLNETSGSTAVNRMTLDPGATASGTVWGGAASPADPSGTSVEFNSNNDRVVGTQQYTNPTTFSLETWIRSTDTNGGRIIGFGDSTGQTSSNYDRHLYLLADGRLRYGVWVGSAATIDSPQAVNDGQWHHVVVTQQPGEQKMYVDGVAVASGTASAQQNYSGYWRLGADNIWSGDRHYRGLIDEAAVYGSVLSPEAVLSHWTAAGGLAPNVNPTASFTAGAVDLAVTFDASGSSDPDGTIVSYDWNFGDGATGSGINSAHTYGAAGTYNVTLTVTDDRGGSATATSQVTVLAPNVTPTAAFSAVVDHLDVDFDASISNDPDGNVVAYAWDFGDGTPTVEGIAPTHTYAGAGTYNVTLTVTDDRGGVGTVTLPVTATLPPNVLPTAAFSSGHVDLTATFDASASSDPDGTIVSHAWDFGDGTQGNGATTAHTYLAAGTYDVTLTVVDDRGGQDTVTHEVTVTDPPNLAPTASFTFGHTDLTANFDASLSSDPEGRPLSYAWTFGDGSGTSTSVAPTYTYAAAGTYGVTLTVTDDAGATASVTWPVTVTDPPPANVSPTASFSSNTSFLTADVDGRGSSDPDGSIVSWSWNWGDGTAPGSGATASHVFAGAGTYTVTLTVTDDDGAIGTVTGQVTVSAPPANVAPTASFTASANDLTLSVDASTSTDPDGSIVSWSWVWGDNTAAGAGSAATHTYAGAGTYTVTLTVTDDDGATDTTSRTVTVTAPVVSNYASDTFSRTVSNALGTADVGGAWTTTGSAASYSVSGGLGRVSTTAGASRTITLGSVAATDTDLRARLGFDKTQTGGGSYVGIIGRRVNSTNDYRLKLRFQSNGSVTAQLVRIVNGTETVVQNLSTVPGLTVNGGEFVRVRLQVTGTNPTNLAAKVWKDGTAEPTAWQLQATDASASLQANGSVGIWDYLSGSATNGPVTMLIDDVVAGPVGGGTPPPTNAAPSAALTSSVTGLDVAVDGSGSSDGDGTVESYSWNWGDGTPAGSGVTAAHTYAVAGTYTITLTVTDDDGATGTSSSTVVVTSGPAPTNFVEDSFGRDTTNGWGSAEIGGAWSTTSTASAYSVSGGAGRITMNAGAGRYASLNSVTQTASDVRASLSLDKAQTGGGTYLAVVGRRVDGSNDYRVKLRVQAGGAVTAQLVRVVNGTETVIQSVATVPGLTWNAGEVLHVRFQVSGTGTTNLAAKVWKDGTAEPTGWTLSGADQTAALQSAGGVGIWSYLSGSATNAPMTLTVDDLVAGPLG